jgi:hypothetical protein
MYATGVLVGVGGPFTYQFNIGVTVFPNLGMGGFFSTFLPKNFPSSH